MAYAVMFDSLDTEGGGNMAFSGPGTADQHHITCSIQKFTTMELTDHSFTHFTRSEVEGGQVLVEK